MSLDDTQLVLIIILIPIILCIIIILEGMRNLIQAKIVFFPRSAEQLDDESLIVGRQNGCFGILYIILGVIFLVVIVYIYSLLTK